MKKHIYRIEISSETGEIEYIEDKVEGTSWQDAIKKLITKFED